MIKDVKEIFFAVVDILREVGKNRSQGKYLHRWLVSLRYKSNSLRYELPWLTYGSIDWIERHLSKEMKVFEWGSGGSTVFLAKRVKKVVSVEHDPNWHKEVTDYLQSKGLSKNAQLIYKNPSKIKLSQGKYSSGQAKHKNYSFKEYCMAISKYPKEYFDLILIDGRARVDCMRLAVKKVKKRGWIVLDNADEDRYWKKLRAIDSFDRLDFKGIGPFNSHSWLTTVLTR